jgi:hypothetical protein
VRVNISDAVKRADAIMNKIDSHLSQKTCAALRKNTSGAPARAAK